MNTTRCLTLALDPAAILRAQGLEPDPWQRDLLLASDPYLLVNCARQSGKSTTVAALALHQALVGERALVLLLAPSERQSQELFRKVVLGYHAVGAPVAALRTTQGELELANGGRIIALPGREDTIRSFSGVDLLVIDEAARVPDDLYRSVRPMLAVSRGRLLALSTPFGQRGWFYEEWQGAGAWRRIHIPWRECPRIGADFIAEEERALGRLWVQQEYECLFTALAGLVYPDFEKAVVEEPAAEGRCAGAAALAEDGGGSKVGGIDFGWRNPFAAVWGVLDDDDVLWIAQERYLRETPLSEHAAALPKDVLWHADPAGATEIAELRRAGLIVRRGDNNIRRGIGLVTERLRTGRLKVSASCRSLVAEARLYRYPSGEERLVLGENPIDANNHALAALRYLVSRLPARREEERERPREERRREDEDERLWVEIG